MSAKYALIIGNTEHTDPGFAQLTTPGKDAEDFARVLKSPDLCAFDDVNVLLNEPSFVVSEAIDAFFYQKKSDDLLIVYFSGHGVRDEYGALYLAVKNTNRARLRATAIRSDYIREAMDQSRSKRQVVILDCCNSGAFPQGTKAEIGGTMGLVSALQGYGRFVLTASDATQFAWEGNRVIGETQNSLFTHFLVKGLEGEADRDGNGRITVDELYDYTFDEISRLTPKQTPTKSISKQEGEIVLRHITRLADIKPVTLPNELTEAIEDSRTFVREGAVQQLAKLLQARNLGLARSAREQLERIEKEDDSRRVSRAASQALEPVRQAERLSAQQVAEKERQISKAQEESPEHQNETSEPKAQDAERITNLEIGKDELFEVGEPISHHQAPSKNTKRLLAALFGSLSILLCCSLGFLAYRSYPQIVGPIGSPTITAVTGTGQAPVALTSTTVVASLTETDPILIQSTSSAMAASTVTAAAKATKTALARSTATAIARATRTAIAVGTIQSRNRYVANLEATAQLLYGPRTGSIRHNSDDQFVSFTRTDVGVNNFILKVTVSNPYPARVGKWDYAIGFRDGGGDNQYRLVITSQRTWELRLHLQSSAKSVQSGELSSLEVTDGSSNTVWLYCQDSYGLLYVNGDFVAELDLSARQHPGNIWIGTNSFEINGHSTDYENLTIRQIP